MIQPSRRAFLHLGVSGAAVTLFAEDPQTDGPAVAQMAGQLTSGQVTARALVERYLARIAAIDRAGPTLRSVIEVNPDALTLADELDKERKDRGPRGPLHGVPILIKDNIDTADRMMTTAGSLALVGSKPPSDAFLVRQLRKAGMVILGKTNLSEWANFRSSRSTSGWSARGGLTRNPYALDRNPSGSSSGSAVAVAADLCAVAVGTETNGSIISPSAVCGIVGLKPTVGLISRTGVIPISATQDTAGPMGRTVADVAALLGALAGSDADDPATADARVEKDYTKFLDVDGLRGVRLGVVRRTTGGPESANALIAAALRAMESRGALLVDLPAETLGRYGSASFTVLLYEFKASLNAHLARLGPTVPVKSLKELIEFNERRRADEMPFFGQELFLQAQAKGALTDKEYAEALARCRRLSRTEGIDVVMDQHHLDALVAPAGGPAGLTDLVYGDRGVGGHSGPAAVAGYPNITVPAGFVFGLPIGISFFGRAWSEPVLLKLAYAFEQATRHRRPPTFPPTASVERGNNP